MKKANRFTILFVCLMLSLMTLFTSFGYASLSGKLAFSGTANWNEPKTVYITAVRVSATSNISFPANNKTAAVTKAGFLVYQHSHYLLNQQYNQYTPGGSVTVEVTVRNNSGIDQYFAKHTTNPDISKSCTFSYPDSNAKPGSLIADRTSKTFKITIQNTSYSQINLKDVESRLIFSPDFNAGDTQTVTKSLADTFANVLAGTGPLGNHQGIVYKGQTIAAKDILKTLQDNMESVDTGGYIGNVGNASQDRKDLVNAIFGDHMVMQIGSSYYTVSVLIKNQQIDNKGESDMVMYITADQLTLGSGYWQNGWKNLNNVPVYALVFINNGGGNYTACDHLFAGEAPVCDFGGAMGDGKSGNFNTNIWNSTEYPNLTDKSGGEINQEWSSTNGELDEAYQEFLKQK